MTTGRFINFNGSVPDWLLPLHQARELGLIPRGGLITIQAGGRVSKSAPAVSVPRGYKPRTSDDLSALVGLDCELLIDDETPYALARGLIMGILNADPCCLWALISGRKQKFVHLKHGGRYGV